MRRKREVKTERVVNRDRLEKEQNSKRMRDTKEKVRCHL